MGLRIPLGIQILCGRFFPPTLGKVPANTFGLKNLNLATFDNKKSQFFTMPLPFFRPPVAPHVCSKYHGKNSHLSKKTLSSCLNFSRLGCRGQPNSTSKIGGKIFWRSTCLDYRNHTLWIRYLGQNC